MKLKQELIKLLGEASTEELIVAKKLIEELLGKDHIRIISNESCISRSIEQKRLFLSDSNKKLLAKNATEVEAFIQETFKPRNRIAEQAITSFLIEMLCDDLVSREIPVTAKIIIEHLTRVKEVFEFQFPGYIQAGLTELIMKKLTRSKK